MGKGNIKEDTRTRGRARNVESKNFSRIERAKDIDIVADIKNEQIGMDWTCSKNGSGKNS